MTQSGGPTPPKSPEGPPSVGGPQAPATTAEMPHSQGFGGPPTLKEALAQRVRFAGGELPLWGVLAPALAAFAVVIALSAAAATARDVVVESAPVTSASAVASASPSASTEPQKSPETKETPSEAPPEKPLTMIERAAAGEVGALAELEERPVADLAIEEAVAIASGRSARERKEAAELRERLARDPALIKNAKVLGELHRFTQNPESAREALAAIANLPGPIGPDLLYEVWTGTPTKTLTTELAQTLLLGKNVRAKAAPPLALALELRTLEDCEAIAKLLPRVLKEADKRSYVALTKLQRKGGCGPQKRDDCYACLRKGDAANHLKEALKVVRTRREPTPFKG